VNGRSEYGYTALHMAGSLDILNALLSRGADPTLLNGQNLSPLMMQVLNNRIDCVARLLNELRVREAKKLQ